MDDHLYRICTAADWAQTQAQGQLPLSELDRRDGYVHLSSAAQVPGTLQRFFAGRRDLLLLSISQARLLGPAGAGALRYEAPSAGPGPADPEAPPREQFPHFYGRVSLNAITVAEPLPLDARGQHQLPAALASKGV